MFQAEILKIRPEIAENPLNHRTQKLTAHKTNTLIHIHVKMSTAKSPTEPAYQIHQNVLAWRGCEQLYLDKRTADVQFVFTSSDRRTIEKVPAHKAILSVNSPVLDALLYGPFKQDGGDINIDGTTIQAFREFLQFFYCRTVKITIGNVAAVMALAARYGLSDCLNACIDLCQTTLTIENMCWGYELAIQSEDQSLVEFCEQKIRENASPIFDSTSFLQCKSNLLRAILQLNGFQCDETVIFDGCIEWAKRACVENLVDEHDGTNIRQQLGNLIYEIRFAGMTVKEFYARLRKYDGLFSAQEFYEIIGIIAANDADMGQLKSTLKFDRTMRKRAETSTPTPTPTPTPKPALATETLATPILSCSRIDLTLSAAMKRYALSPLDCTVFSSNCALKLTKIHCSEIFCGVEPRQSIPFGMKIVEMNAEQTLADGNAIYFRQMSLNPIVTTVIEFPTPISIQTNQKYGIVLQFQWWNLSCFNLLVHKPTVHINDSVSIEFYTAENDYGCDCQRFGLITQMDFVASADA